MSVHVALLFVSFGKPSISWIGIGVIVVLLFLSHGVSHILNYVQGDEFRSATIKRQMFRPYPRVVVMHIIVIFGGFLILPIGAPVIAIVLLVLGKTLLDAISHVTLHTIKL